MDHGTELAQPSSGNGETPSAPFEEQDDRLWWLAREVETRRMLTIEYQRELAAQEQRIEALRAGFGQVAELRALLAAHESRWADLEASVGWALLTRLQALRARLLPPASARNQWLEALWRRWRARHSLEGYEDRLFTVEPVSERPAPPPHQQPVAIIVCVHNALDDIQRCLASVLAHSTAPYDLILVDDGSDRATAEFLSAFAAQHGATLLRNDTARGYTLAANQGLAAADAPWLLLLNSDTIVTPGWLDRLIACAASDPRIGLVGPLSNTASWQSIPDIEDHGDWAANPLPPGISAADMGALLEAHSARLYPRVPLLNGFCLLIRRAVIDAIGPFDEETFGPGYGEEDDLALRARKAGWSLAIADDTYVYHAQSRSYTSEARQRLASAAGQRLAAKHGQSLIDQSVAHCLHDRVLQGIRARSRAMVARRDWIARGRERFAGARLLFVLPVTLPGGGANVVIDEALAMRAMGVEVGIFNLLTNRAEFERAYPHMPLPVHYGQPEDLGDLSSDYDAVIATFNTSVEWLAPLSDLADPPVRGYYVQGFEPLIYPQHLPGYQRALQSYTLFPDLVRFTKTEWTRRQVLEHTGADSTVVGPSVNIDLFRPRPAGTELRSEAPLRIAAMVRPNSPYRAPHVTMRVLQRAARRYGDAIEIVLFGTTLDDPELARLPHRFPWRLAGVLSQRQVASLLASVDIFCDFSSHQAMGLTALEAMACGAVTIVPRHGGAVEFTRHNTNGLVIDTSSVGACWRALRRLIERPDLRQRLQERAIADVCELFPERAAYGILEALLGSGRRGTP
jgi:GT2 family glycosyltransferase